MAGETIPPGVGDRPARFYAIVHSPEDVEAKSRAIHRGMLTSSPHIREVNFIEIATADLAALYRDYDREFFGGLLSELIREDGSPGLRFRLSNRMTSAAGKASTRRLRSGAGTREAWDYEVAVSTTLLFGTFRDPTRPAMVGGRPCANRLEALQRILEHELLHIVEYLGWRTSSCAAENFRRLSRRIFGHEAWHHELITPREEAAVAHGIRPGDRVSFEFEGVRRIGLVNRITKRATVLVENPAGRRFSDGKTYATFYVPVSFLTKVG